MKLKLKIPAWQLLLVISFFLLGNEIKAQSKYLNDAYANGKYYYTNGQFLKVYNALIPNINSMNDKKNWDHYKGTEKGIERVFQVYKMVIESAYELNQNQRAESFENWIIKYYKGIIPADEVFDYLDYTEL